MSVFLFTVFGLPTPLLVTLVGAIITLILYGKSLLKSREIMPVIYYKDSALATHILKKCRQLCTPFRPPIWLLNQHVQTIVSNFLLPKPAMRYDREYLLMRDRGVVSLDWALVVDRRIRETSSVLIIIPDLTSDATSVSSLTQAASDRGFRVVVFNRRGHANSFLTSPKLQGFGDPTDLRQVVKYIRGMYSRANVVAVAVGTGSGLLLSYLGEHGSSAHISAAVCISACYEAQEVLGKQLRSFYDFLYLFRLKKILCVHARALSDYCDMRAAMTSWTFQEFDENLYCKIYGHKSIEEYWERNNPMRDVDDIAVPLMCINSLDDPMFSNDFIPYDLFRCYPNLFLVVTDKGGHCGFLENISGISWADRLAVGFIEALLDAQLKMK